MTLREFRNMVARTSPNGSYAYMAVRRKNGGFFGRTGNVWKDTALGFSFCAREEYGYTDWGMGDVPVIGIEVVEAYGEYVPCAVIE